MKPVKLATALATALLLAAPAISFAQEAAAPAAEEEESPLSWSVAVASDYVFRGVSQTDEKPALQAGLTYTFPVGIYVGAWASNVDFEDGGPEVEVDGYVGYNTDLNDQWNLDVSVVRYAYLGADDDYGHIDYNEFIGKLAYAATETVSITGLVAFANDYVNTGENETYAGLQASFDVGSGVSLTVGTGYTTIDFDDGSTDDYFDGLVTVSRDFGPVNANLGYYDTFGSDAKALKDAGDVHDGRVALLLTIAQ